MSLTRHAWQWHRWLAYAVGLQVLVWLTSGLLFAWLPFKTWVKGEDLLRRPALELPPAWAMLPPEAAAWPVADVRSAQLIATPNGAAWRLSLRGEPVPRLWPADGRDWVEPDADAVRRFAIGHYAGSAAVATVERLERVPRRLGLVDEVGGRVPVWRVHFDDALSTRLYFDGRTGEFLALRTEAWVWYDFFWRLHIMDYLGGEDFNGTLLRAAASTGWLLGAAGAVLAVLALRRAWRRRTAASAGSRR